MAAMIKIIATTISNSMSENPFSLLVMSVFSPVKFISSRSPVSLAGYSD
jgi:hypothetical protein